MHLFSAYQGVLISQLIKGVPLNYEDQHLLCMGSWGHYIIPISWGDYIIPISWGDYIIPISWGHYIIPISWGHYIIPIYPTGHSISFLPLQELQPICDLLFRPTAVSPQVGNIHNHP